MRKPSVVLVLQATNQISDISAVEEECAGYPRGDIMWYISHYASIGSWHELTWTSFSVYAPRINEEGIQA